MTKGLDLCLENLTKLEVKAPKVAREAVTMVAEEFKKELEVNTPVSDELTLTRLKEDIKISNFKGRGGAPSKDIGFGRSTGWRAKFPDSGTIYQKAQDFEEKTINVVTPRAKEIYKQKIREVLK
ncbi:HK97-gp10 family putative phage morphogenesis protein [Streptococcus oralis]|uniref:HK97-gp10 family putative phage morphogenesis protein n=1 Tax=Streptococcus oralis TaxID=1303 RepID=UPI0019D11086|nr:HK97-gp10 family putative phage morphogenesis protein [Streptococcus oralis]MBN6012492.1 HK97 gp10 family phage protein [Streptococcus oralis subsp. oralis]